MPAEQKCPDCGQSMNSAYAYVSGICPTHGVRVVLIDIQVLREALREACVEWDSWMNKGMDVEEPQADDFAAFERISALAFQRTEEPSDDEGLEPIETSPLTEREPDL